MLIETWPALLHWLISNYGPWVTGFAFYAVTLDGWKHWLKGKKPGA